ncbi:MAG: redoxin domain-containing protein, partial [Cyclobacteriaceae bacterium]
MKTKSHLKHVAILNSIQAGKSTFSYCFIVITSLMMFFTACGNKKSQDSTSEETADVNSNAKFVANPQVIEPVDEVTVLPIGSKAPEFNLPATDGNYYSLDDFSDAKALVILFTCNHCPTAQAYEERMKQIVVDYEDKGVQVVAISPNSPIAVLHEELGYSDMGDSFEDMIVWVKEMEYNFPYLYDGDTHEYSIAYGPVATPHAYVFDKDRILQYTGRLDASEKPGSANAEDLRAAIDAVLANEPVAQHVTKTFGCSVKWSWKNEWTEKVNKEWEQKTVNIEEIDESGIKKLLQNDSDKLRLINVWATWCGPCVIEYPEFVTIHRMFSGRDFEFISISADKPEH